VSPSPRVGDRYLVQQWGETLSVKILEVTPSGRYALLQGRGGADWREWQEVHVLEPLLRPRTRWERLWMWVRA
jgi:hypothetical protein